MCPASQTVCVCVGVCVCVCLGQRTVIIQLTGAWTSRINRLFYCTDLQIMWTDDLQWKYSNRVADGQRGANVV